MKTGVANLPMHWGKAPKWLFSLMTKLARQISIVIIEEYGPNEMLERLSDPYWFQAFGCILGFDWHSSGVTTTVCGAIKEGLGGIEKSLQFYTAGGKGGTSRKTPIEIQNWIERNHLNINPEDLKYASKMCAKVDSSAIQDGYQLYHHNFFFTNDGSWTVVQQGMPTNINKNNRFARRYHWTSRGFNTFVNCPKNNICDNKRYQHVLNLTSLKSKNSRNLITKISRIKPHKLVREYEKIVTLNMPKREWIEENDIKPSNLKKILISTYERQPKDFENLLSMKGVGPKSIRALNLISEITYGTKADWKDPAKFSFAHGGKDGYPYPVDRNNYDKSIEILKRSIKKSKLEKREKNTCLLKLLENF